MNDCAQIFFNFTVVFAKILSMNKNLLDNQGLQLKFYYLQRTIILPSKNCGFFLKTESLSPVGFMCYKLC